MKKAATTLTVLIAAVALSVSAYGYDKDLKLGDKLNKSNAGDNSVKIAKSVDKFIEQDGISVKATKAAKQDKFVAIALKSTVDYGKEGFITKLAPASVVTIKSDKADKDLTVKNSAQLSKFAISFLDADVDIDCDISQKIKDLGVN